MPDIIEISIIIPCRNEEQFIGRCLDSILDQDYPKDKLEVLVIDGRSEDRTRSIIRAYTKRYPFIKLLDNPKRSRPAALNIGVKYAQGKFIMRMDAHSALGDHYITKCRRFFKTYGADVVGGRMITLPQDDTRVGRAIAKGLSHPFGVGTSYFRTEGKRPRWVDTVFCGCYNREVFEQVGPWDERIALSEDLSYSRKARELGFKILLVPEVTNYYWARSSLPTFFRHNFRNGLWAILPFRFVKMPISPRHMVPFAFVLGLLGTGILMFFSSFVFWLFLVIIAFYFGANFYFSITIAVQEKEWRYLFLMPLIFITLHMGYGLGSLWGLLRLALSSPLRERR